MTFLFPSLLIAGLGLVAAPVLLHLLNLQRQAPLAWAAMDFLLESEARNRAWINLKQWLLLAARVAAIVLAALMVARPTLTGGLAAWLPGERVHHLVLLDDSYSMSDRNGGDSAWRSALSALDAIARRAAESPGHRLTVLRGSDSASEATVANNADEFVTLRNAAPVWRPTQRSSQLDESLAMLADHAERTPDGERVAAYVLSDFRQRDLQAGDQLAAALRRLADRASDLVFASCVDRQNANLTLGTLTLAPGSQVAGVELTGELAVTNHGPGDVGRTAVRLWRDGAPLPAIEFEGVPAGAAVSRRFPIRFAEPGAHRLRAELPADSVDADNHRFLAADLPAERPVLVADGSRGAEGQVFATALRPRRADGVGWRPRRIQPASLAAAGDLTPFAAVLLLDVGRLDDAAALAVRRYVAGGGGVLIVLGDHIDRRFYNEELFAGRADALLPIRLDVPTQTATDDRGRPKRVRVASHPALRVFEGGRSGFLDLLRVHRRHALLPSAGGDAGSPPVRTLATLGADAPLLIESTAGPGRVVCLLTATARSGSDLQGWSNLSVSPTFPILVQELTAHIASPRLRPRDARVGVPWPGVVSAAAPRATRLMRLDGERFVLLARLSEEQSVDAPRSGEAELAGVYRLESGGGEAPVSLAVNVDPDEGAMKLVAPGALRQRFPGVDLSVIPAAQLAGARADAGAPLFQRLGVLLLVLLAIEQAIAYACSYHRLPATRGGPV